MSVVPVCTLTVVICSTLLSPILPFLTFRTVPLCGTATLASRRGARGGGDPVVVVPGVMG